MVVFECKKCGDVFEEDGLHVIIHDKSVGRVCPACLANAERITVVVERERPGKPYVIAHVGIEVPDANEKTEVLTGKRT